MDYERDVLFHGTPVSPNTIYVLYANMFVGRFCSLVPWGCSHRYGKFYGICDLFLRNCVEIVSKSLKYITEKYHKIFFPQKYSFLLVTSNAHGL